MINTEFYSILKKKKKILQSSNSQEPKSIIQIATPIVRNEIHRIKEREKETGKLHETAT